MVLLSVSSFALIVDDLLIAQIDIDDLGQFVMNIRQGLDGA